ncbi:19291_t:CDS:2 [Entrophospora sp. SA101]|nr:19291_t:CDS:2 [Entrophospora sp. SA101]
MVGYFQNGGISPKGWNKSKYLNNHEYCSMVDIQFVLQGGKQQVSQKY